MTRPNHFAEDEARRLLKTAATRAVVGRRLRALAPPALVALIIALFASSPLSSAPRADPADGMSPSIRAPIAVPVAHPVDHRVMLA